MRGERERGKHQLETIHGQLDEALFGALFAPDRPAIEAFVRAVSGLSWSDLAVVQSARARATAAQEYLSPAGAVCDDMRAWAMSGYRSLSAHSRDFEREANDRADDAVQGARLGALLKAYEGPAERGLALRTAGLRQRFLVAAFSSEVLAQRLHHTLGEPESLFERREHAPIIARGRTRAGSRFTIRAERREGLFASHCRHPISVNFEEMRKGRRGGLFTSGFGTSDCISRHPRGGPGLECGEREQSIFIVVTARVRSVILRLSDGRAIRSSVVRVGRRYGGPAGIYVEALRGLSRHPVSLTELDREGRIVRVVRFDRRELCSRRGLPAPPHFVDLVEGLTPNGDRFTIEGSSVRIGRHDISFDVYASAREYEVRERGDGLVEFGRETQPKVFPWSLAVGCPPHEFEIVYGVLTRPGDSVLARTGAATVVLAKVAVPAGLGSKGPLVYGVFTALPDELIIRKSDGSTLYSESLATRAREHREFCEGYGEP